MTIASSVLVILTAAIAVHFANVTSGGIEIVVASIGSFCCTLPSAQENCGIPIEIKKRPCKNRNQLGIYFSLGETFPCTVKAVIA